VLNFSAARCSQEKFANLNNIGMDLIPPQYKQENVASRIGASIKSRGISLSDGESKLSLLKERKVFLSLAAVIVALLVFGGIEAYDIFVVQKEASRLELEINSLQEKQDSQKKSEIGKKVINIDKMASAVETLSKKHIYSSLFFEALERITLPQVQWLNYSIDALKGTADLNGSAASYSILAKQIVSFEDAKFKIAVSGISLKKNGVDFSAKTSFDPSILLKQGSQ